jgi:hypothetical protein
VSKAEPSSLLVEASSNLPELEKFIQYAADNNLALLQLHRGKKRPVGDVWQNRWSIDPLTWRQWAAEGYNLGIHLGASKLICIDPDTIGGTGDPNAWANWTSWCAANDLQEYPPHSVTASGSWHIFFRIKDGETAGTPREKIGSGVDVLTGGKNAVAPGSYYDGSEGKRAGQYRFFNPNPPPPHDAPTALMDLFKRKPRAAANGSGEFDDYADIQSRCEFLADADGYLADEFNWVKSVWGLRKGFGDRGWPLAEIISYRDHKNRLGSVWEREDPDSENPATCATLIAESNKAGYREWKRAHLFDGIVALMAAAPANDNPHPLIAPGTPVPAAEAAPAKPIEIKATWKSAADLHDRTFAAIKYVIPKYLAEGCTLLAGRPKIGKSWLTEDWALNVADGGETLGEKVEQGDVLLLALEDNERRLQDRFKKILGPFRKPSTRLYYETEWPRTDEGGLEKIEAWITAMPNPKLIIIDVLARIRPLQQGRAPQYDIDYQIVASLQKIASARRIAIVVVTHVRKSGSESGDAIDKISGTLGLSGAADSFMVLDRDGQGVTLYTRGRDIEEISVAIEFKPGRCRWTVLGQAGEVRKSDERRLILDALNGSGTGMTRADLVAATEMKSNNVGVLLNKMMKAGEIMKTVGGCYLTSTPDNTVTAVTPIIGHQQISSLGVPPMPPPY